ncbi:MAG: glycoside hydrolase family 97 protein [Muribaculaceae bacterium]|nr:glycoside hydrolase family 97 protein [Muribaculaceae bacterium]
MNKAIVSFIALTASLALWGKPVSVSSPDGNITVSVDTDSDGALFYSVERAGKAVLEPSRLGLRLADAPDMADGFSIKKVERASADDVWQPVWGEESEIRNSYNEMKLTLQQKKLAPGRSCAVTFRVFDDGLGFRYEYPRSKSLGDFTITDELTEFKFTQAHPSWSISADKVNYYEGIYRPLPLDSIGLASTPVTIKTADGLSMALHEAALTDYASMRVQATPGSTMLKADLAPWSSGEKVFVTDVRTSPWRTLIIADNDGDMMLSRIMLNLNEPCAIDDTSWIVPQRYIGVWWGYHMRTHTWKAGPKHGATTENVMKYIDFAARHGFGGVLVEGWNKGWENYEFSFTEPYDDFDIDSICSYARSKGVGFIAHHETGCRVDNYEANLTEAMKYLSDKGVHYVKTGYCDYPLLNKKERHASQFGVRHFRKVIEEGARHRVAIDNHEPVMPTGLQRTYPNLMTQEGVRGQEWDAWNRSGGNPPSHTVTLPFTRGLAGPMDFTPVTFSFENPIVPQTRVCTTLAKQLALFVILYSPLQMASDMIENYEANPGPLTFVSDCPTDWARTVYPEAELGRYITVARKAKDSDTWYVAGATGDDARTASVDFSFLDPDAEYEALIYRDAPDADWETNPTPVVIERKKVDASTVLPVWQARSGGFAMKVSKK